MIKKGNPIVMESMIEVEENAVVLYPSIKQKQLMIYQPINIYKIHNNITVLQHNQNLGNQSLHNSTNNFTLEYLIIFVIFVVLAALCLLFGYKLGSKSSKYEQKKQKIIEQKNLLLKKESNNVLKSEIVEQISSNKNIKCNDITPEQNNISQLSQNINQINSIQQNQISKTVEQINNDKQIMIYDKSSQIISPEKIFQNQNQNQNLQHNEQKQENLQLMEFQNKSYIQQSSKLNNYNSNIAQFQTNFPVYQLNGSDFKVNSENLIKNEVIDFSQNSTLQKVNVIADYSVQVQDNQDYVQKIEYHKVITNYKKEQKTDQESNNKNEKNNFQIKIQASQNEKNQINVTTNIQMQNLPKQFLQLEHDSQSSQKNNQQDQTSEFLRKYSMNSEQLLEQQQSSQILHQQDQQNRSIKNEIQISEKISSSEAVHYKNILQTNSNNKNNSSNSDQQKKHRLSASKNNISTQKDEDDENDYNSSEDHDEIINFVSKSQDNKQKINQKNSLKQANFLKIQKQPSSTTSKHIQNDIFETGRFLKLFENAEEIGQGGFGIVYRANHKVDKFDYAIKRVYLSLKQNETIQEHKYFREIQSLITFNHKNVMRYYGCWIEESDNENQNEYSRILQSSSQNPFNNNKQQTSNNNQDSFLKSRFYGLNNKQSFEFSEKDIYEQSRINNNKNNNNLSKYTQSKAHTSMSDLGFQWDQNDDQQQQQSEITDQSNSESCSQSLIDNKASTDKVLYQKNTNNDDKQTDTQQNNKNNLDNINKQLLILYIQVTIFFILSLIIYLFFNKKMKYCKEQTFKQLLENPKREICTIENFNFFKQMLEGLLYIHQQGIIHRDIKPANIFLDCEKQILIGDFGLATRLYDSDSEQFEAYDNILNNQNYQKKSLTFNVGTPLYLAPEQECKLQQNNKQKLCSYNKKVDVYALGLILFEMYLKFTTEHERFQLFNNLKQKNEVPDYITDKFLEEKNLILLLIQKQPEMRPTVSEIFQNQHYLNWKQKVKNLKHGNLNVN